MEQKHIGLHTFPFWYDCMWHAYQTDSCDITKPLTPPLPLVTICRKSGEPLPPLGCDVIYGQPLRADDTYIVDEMYTL